MAATGTPLTTTTATTTTTTSSSSSSSITITTPTSTLPLGGGLHSAQAKGLLAPVAAREQHLDHSDTQTRSETSTPPSSGSMTPTLPDRKLTPNDFHRVRTLGTGTFARVVLVRPATGNEANRNLVYALKILRKTEVVKLRQIDHVRHERAILNDVAGHPFITNLHASFTDREFLYLVLDYVPGGELFSYLRKFRLFDETTARFYAAEIVLVLEYLHEQQGGVAYRDLKPENLLLDADGHIKLVDFGFAKRLGFGQDKKPAETYTLCGTPEYLAPEVIHNKGHTTAVDWWALGILLYEFLTGFPPFWHQNPIEIYKQIVENPIVFPEHPVVSPVAKDIILQFCTVDRSKRLGNIKGGTAEVKAHPFFNGIDWDAVLARTNQGPFIPRIRFPGDAQCFDIYPEEDTNRDEYTDEMADQYDPFFKDF